MSQFTPHVNPDTLHTEPFEVADCEAVPGAPGALASPRPVNRLRPGAETVEFPMGPVEYGEGEAVPAPPGTPARPRPPGRERPVSVTSPSRSVHDLRPEALSVGDLVTLRSGGPSMTVLGFDPTPRDGANGLELVPVRCAWFHQGEFFQQSLPRAALARVPSCR